MDDNTKGHYQQVLNNFKEFEGKNKVKLTDLSNNLLDKFSIYLSDDKGYAEKTTKRKIGRIKFFCQRAESENIAINKNYKERIFVKEEETEYKQPYLNEEEIKNPRAYPAQAANGAKKTREQVQQELGQAIKSGEMMAAGESGAKLNEITPGSYPSQAVAAVSPKSRDEVKHELAEAIFHGEIIANGEDGRMLKDVFPGMYRGSHAADIAAERGYTGSARGL